MCITPFNNKAMQNAFHKASQALQQDIKETQENICVMHCFHIDCLEKPYRRTGGTNQI